MTRLRKEAVRAALVVGGGTLIILFIGAADDFGGYVGSRQTTKRDSIIEARCTARLNYAQTRTDTIVIAGNDGCWKFVDEEMR